MQRKGTYTAELLSRGATFGSSSCAPAIFKPQTFPLFSLSKGKLKTQPDVMDASPLTRGKQWSASSRALYCCAVCPPACLGFLTPSLCGMCFRRCLISCGCNDATPSLKSNGKAATIFFEGCGFAFPFGLGVAKHIQETYVVDDSLSVYSISAGAFAALLLVLNMDPIEIINSKLERILVNFLDSTPCYGTFGTLSSIADALEDILPSDAHLICSGRLNIVTSSWPCLGFHIVSTFPTRESLIQTVITSCTFPGFAWRPRCTNCPCEFDAGFQVRHTLLWKSSFFTTLFERRAY